VAEAAVGAAVIVVVVAIAEASVDLAEEAMAEVEQVEVGNYNFFYEISIFHNGPICSNKYWINSKHQASCWIKV
jgi:hypothetical protein